MSRFKNPFRREPQEMPVEDSSAARGSSPGGELFTPENSSSEPFMAADAWPAKIEIGTLKAGVSEVLLETVTMGSAEPSGPQAWPAKWYVPEWEPDGGSSAVVPASAPTQELAAQQEPEQAGTFFDGRLLTAEDLAREQSATADAWPSKIEVSSLDASGGDTSVGGAIPIYRIENAWPKSDEGSDSPSTMADLSPGADGSAPVVEEGEAAADIPDGAEDLLEL
jgi:hypothetical protein